MWDELDLTVYLLQKLRTLGGGFLWVCLVENRVAVITIYLKILALMQILFFFSIFRVSSAVFMCGIIIYFDDAHSRPSSELFALFNQRFTAVKMIRERHNFDILTIENL
jgi:hypothetical protein